jgi:hypothetical protein
VTRRRPRELERVPAYIETGFSRRLKRVFDDAMKNREWAIALALPGDGKSFWYRQFLLDHPVTKVDGVTKTDVLGTRVPQFGISRNALMFRLGARLGLLLPGKPAFYFVGFIAWVLAAGVQVVAIDDAHELTRDPRKWLRECIDTLADPDQHPGLEPARVGVVLLANGLPDGKAATPLFSRSKRAIDFDWLQFERRLDTVRPVVWVEGLDENETGEALAGLELAYRPQFPELDLQSWAGALFDALLAPEIDYANLKRARMDSIVKCVVMALSNEAEVGGYGEGVGPKLDQAVQRLRLRPEELGRYSYRDLVTE